MKYDVCVRVDGYVGVSVEAENDESAKRMAAEKVGEMDFGVLRDVEWEPIHSKKAASANSVYTIDINWSCDGSDTAHCTQICGTDFCQLKEQVFPIVLNALLRDGYSDCIVVVTATVECDGKWLDTDEFAIDYKEAGVSSVLVD